MDPSICSSKLEYIDTSPGSSGLVSTSVSSNTEVWDNVVVLDSPVESIPFPKEIWRSNNETTEGFSHSLTMEDQRHNEFTFSSNNDFQLPTDDPFEALWVDQGLGQSSAPDEESTNTDSKFTTITFSKPSCGISGEDSKRRLHAAHYDKNDGCKKRRHTTSKADPGLACPFRKHDPAKYGIQGGWRICALSQWDSIARLKEHLYRSHMAPSFCQRCKTTFESRHDLDLHISGLIACDPHSKEPPEGITPARMQQLKSRKTGKRHNQSKDGKWEEIYKILFPDVVELPDPYFEPIQEEPVHAILNDYEAFSEQAMSNLFRTKLDTEFPFTVLSTDLKDNLVSLLEFCNITTLESYRSTLTTFVPKPTAPPLSVAVDTSAQYSCPSSSPVFPANEALLLPTSLSPNEFTLDMGRIQDYEGRDQVQAF